MKKEILRRNNTNGISKDIFYCGVWAFNEKRTKIIKFLNLFKSLIGINNACYIHDKHYTYLFSKELKILTFLKWKLFIDTLFLFNCFKYAYKNKKSTIRFTHRLVISIIFYFIVLIATPIYFYMYRN